MLLRIPIYQPKKRTTKVLRLILIIAYGLLPFLGISSDNNKTNVNPDTLFSRSTPIEFEIQMDMGKILNDKSADPQYSTAFLIQKIDEKNMAFNIKIKARGNTRRIRDICDFPPLKSTLRKSQ